MDVEDQIVQAGAQIIWVLEQNQFLQPGTAEDCRNILDSFGSTQGWCVGDGQTLPTAGVFDNSPFSVQRGFDIIVPRQSMQIVYSTSHGTPMGNENITGEELLAKVQEVVAGL